LAELTEVGLELIKSFEGLRLQSYQDSGGIWTIGYGHTKGVKPGQKITEAQADEFLTEDLEQAEADVQTFVKFPLSDNEYSALVSFAFNLGARNLRDLVSYGKARVPSRIMLFNHVQGRQLPGLTRRRAAERKLFLGG